MTITISHVIVKSMNQERTGLSDPENKKRWRRAARIAQRQYPKPGRYGTVVGIGVRYWSQYYGHQTIPEYIKTSRINVARTIRAQRQLAFKGESSNVVEISSRG